MGPPRLSPSPVPPSSEHKPPTSFRKGRGGCGSILACEEAVAALMEPTSLNRGEGLAFRSTGDVGGGKGESEDAGREVVVDEGE
jgi:hypothetical protein